MTPLVPRGCQQPRTPWAKWWACLPVFALLASLANAQTGQLNPGFSAPKAAQKPGFSETRASRSATPLASRPTSDVEARLSEKPGFGQRPPSDFIATVYVTGIATDDATEIQRALRCQPGQQPSRQRLHDDVETLLATGRFAKVQTHWQPTPDGWVLTYQLSKAAEPFVFRGQSDPFEPEGHSPPSKPSTKFPPLTVTTPEEAGESPATSSQTLAEPLADVRIEGNHTISLTEIERKVKVRKGRVVTQEMIKDDVNALVRTRWFASVTPTVRRSEQGPVLVFEVVERPIVRSVEYRGWKKIKQPKLEALTNLKEGSPYDVSANRECARRIEEMYHEKGFAFATVELERGNDKEDREVVFVINEGAKVKVGDVKFEGNEFFSDALLDLKLQTKKRILWTFGGKYDPATIPADKASLKGYYNGLGFFDVTIEDSMQFNDDKSLVQIVYTISEGPRYKIRQVDVIGAEVIPEADLRQDHSIAPGEFYTARKINVDVQKMQEKYGKLGRLFAKVDAVPRFTEEPGVVDILYKIDEDKVYRIRETNIHIAGDHPHTRTNLGLNMMLVQPGDLADPQKIQKSKRRLEGSGVFESGPELGPRMDIKRVEDPSWVQQPQNEINVARGQEAAQPHQTAFPPAIVLPKPLTPKPARPEPPVDVLPLEPGDFFFPPSIFGEGEETEAPIIRGQGDVLLAQSQGPVQNPQNFLFDASPQGDPLRRSINDPDPNLWQQLPPPEFIDIDTYLTEARTGRLMFGVGVNSNSGVVGNIVLSENNFDILRPPRSWDDIWNGTAWRGAGQKFRIEALPGSEVSRYLVDWQDPYFLDSNVNLGVSGFYFTRFYRNWDEERLGGRVRVGRQMSQTWSASAALRLEGVHIADIPAVPPQSLLDVLGDTTLSTVRGSLIHDTRDAAMVPSEGHYLEFSVEQAFAEFTYTRLEIDGRQFFTTYRRPDGYGKHILTLSGNFGWTGSDTPIYEKFYAGGFQSFRGFAFRGVTPLENGVEVGGQFQLLGTAEYMLPVTANEMIKVVGFTDFGTVEEDVTLDNFRLSVGTGLRIQVPGMGPVPIALDWAVPVMKTDFDREQLFSFYIGINR
jgi:outer membrane protein insertion porin family